MLKITDINIRIGREGEGTHYCRFENPTREHTLILGRNESRPLSDLLPKVYHMALQEEHCTEKKIAYAMSKIDPNKILRMFRKRYNVSKRKLQTLRYIESDREICDGALRIAVERYGWDKGHKFFLGLWLTAREYNLKRRACERTRAVV